MTPPTEHLYTLREAIESKATYFWWKTETLEVQIGWEWDAEELAAAWEDESSEDDDMEEEEEDE